VPLRLKTIKEGSFVTTAGAVIDGALTSRAIHTVKVQAAGLLLDLTGPTKRYTDRDGTWELRVRNVGALPLHDVVVRDRLPPELSFRSATAGGRFENGEVIWSLGTLAPGEQRPLQLTATATAVAARAVQTVTATAGPVSQRTEQAVEILALPAVHMDAMVAEPVVRVGSRARFTVLVTNRGASPERDVVVTGLFPRELTPVGGEGPQPGRVTANAVTFPAVASVGPGETVRYTLEADARTVGDVRFRAEMVTGHLTVPVASEAGVRVVGGQ
jgi:uncharacterized repeat protein (TIGR01451 family)